MPRRRPDGIDKGVVEHRIAFGDLERRELRELIKRDMLRKDIEAGGKVVKSVAFSGAVVGTAYLGYMSFNLMVQWLEQSRNFVPEIPPEIRKAAEEAGLNPSDVMFPVSWSGPVGWIYRGGRIIKSRYDAGEMIFPSLGF